MTLVEDPLLSVEDFIEEGRIDPASSESDALPKLTSPTSALTQVTPGSECLTPIILDDGR